MNEDEKAFYEKFKNEDLMKCCFIEYVYRENEVPACGIGGNTQYAVYGIYLIIKKLCENIELDFYDVINILEDMKKIDEYNAGEPA